MVVASGEEPPEEVKVSGTMGGDKEMGIDLDDKPELLLDSLNAWWEKVAWGSCWGFLGFLTP